MSDRKAVADMTAEELREKVRTLGQIVVRLSKRGKVYRERIRHLERRRSVWRNRAEHWKGEAVRARQGRPPKEHRYGRHCADFKSPSVTGTLKAIRKRRAS